MDCSELTSAATSDEATWTPYDSLSSHSILLIDSGNEESSELALALAISGKAASKYSHYNMFLSATAAPGGAAARLRDWLRMELPDISKEIYEEMLRLRAVVIDWDRVPDARACCEEVRLAYPCLALFVVMADDNERAVHDYFDSARLGDYPFIYRGPDRYQTAGRMLGEHLDQIVDRRYDTPYWDSLRKYASHPAISFHALPLGQSRSLSQSLTDLASFYGERHFAAETSLSTAPLDSLLMPRSTIQQAQAKAAYAFGAQLGLEKRPLSFGTRFVTNGTSTANAVVISAFVRPGDHVLIERTSHISHYHALAYVHAKPVMLEPFSNPWGAIGPVPTPSLERSFDNLLEHHHVLPSALILTNPTFDGLHYRPTRIVDAIHRILSDYWHRHFGTAKLASLVEETARAVHPGQLPESAAEIPQAEFLTLAFKRMVFLFDEAWSARAYFHPRMIEFTAMRASWDLSRRHEFNYTDCLRFYATQSTHKSLSALRQGSMIHYRDPLMETAEVREIFEQAYRAHCTTSPSASIIASLDVARRQAQLEGTLLIERCIKLAETFRQDFAHERPGDPAECRFFVLDEHQMLTNASPDRPALAPEDYFLDPTHITLSWNMQLSGKEVRQQLLDNAIQVNKYARHSILAIFNIGIDDSSVRALRAALRNVARDQSQPSSRDRHVPHLPIRLLPCVADLHRDRDMGYWMQNLGALPSRFYDIRKLLDEFRQAADTVGQYIAATFVVPYPPGYPVLVPGQVVTSEHLEFLLDIHIGDTFGVHREGGCLSIMLYHASI